MFSINTFGPQCAVAGQPIKGRWLPTWLVLPTTKWLLPTACYLALNCQAGTVNDCRQRSVATPIAGRGEPEQKAASVLRPPCRTVAWLGARTMPPGILPALLCVS